MMRPTDEPLPMTALLRRKIDECGLSFYLLSRETGVERMSLTRFARGESTLRLDMAERLAAFFGLELREKKR